MAVIVVGDIDPAEIERLITQHFSGLQPGGAPRTVYPIPDHADTRYVSVSDVEAQGSSVSVTHKGPLRRCARPATTAGLWCARCCIRC